MKGTLSKVLIFAAGAAVGSVVTWKICKNKYETLAQEEIDSVKEVFSVKKDEIEVDEIDEEESETEIVASPVGRVHEKPDLQEYARRIAEYREELANDEIDELEENFNGIYFAHGNNVLLYRSGFCYK